jgi:site-specific DNA recombinase
MAPLFERYGVQLWTPGGGRAGVGAEDHEQTMPALGYQPKREVTRARVRVRTAMATQFATWAATSAAGLRLPAGGCRAGPEKAHAEWGRAHRLEPGPGTALVVG